MSPEVGGSKTTYVRPLLKEEEAECFDRLLDEFIDHAYDKGLRFDVAATLKYGTATVTFVGRRRLGRGAS